MLYLHETSLSPDPTYGKSIAPGDDNRLQQLIHPGELKRVDPPSASARTWGKRLNIFKRPPALTLRPTAERHVEIVVDFGTELDAELELDITTKSVVSLVIWQGECLPECEGYVLGRNPDQRTARYLPKAGRHHVTLPPRGFRFVRLVFSDVRGVLTIHQLAARASFTFRERQGDLHCSDRRFQRAWQSSVYTARLCTQSNTLWDGVKRDRAGWFGDARVTKLAIDHVFFDPHPAEKMLATMPTDQWANTIPNYSFDGIAMLRQHVLFYGLERPCVKECFQRMKALLAWIKKTQVGAHGFLKRTDREYYGGMGFLDYSPHPIGGTFEELCWIQCKYLEALRCAIDVALLLKDGQAAHDWQQDADRLAKAIIKRFWKPGTGFIHTLNHVGPAGNIYASGHTEHYQRTYIDKIKLGPSGPSRHSNSLAVFAGLATPAMKSRMLRTVFQNEKLPAINTAYFSYFEKSAWAACGDPAGAILGFRDYLSEMLETEDCATLWELYIPALQDSRKYGNGYAFDNPWSTSLCHGWGAGLVPVAARHLLGIRPTSPGYGSVTLKPLGQLPWTFQAIVPTPEGPIRVRRDDPRGPVRYSIPKTIRVESEVDPSSFLLLE